MHLYTYYCPRCDVFLERFATIETMHLQECDVCGAHLEKRISVPARLNTDTDFMAGAGVASDGLPDQQSRKIAYAKAKKAGVNISGKRWHPGLCRRGVTFDPEAWYGDRAEVIQKADRLGRCVEGSINHVSPIRDEHLAKAEAPYRPSASAVQPEVNREIQQEHGGRATREKRRELTEKYRDRYAGTPAPSGPVNLFE